MKDIFADELDTAHWRDAAKHKSFHRRATQNLRKYGPDNALLTEANFEMPAAIAGNCAANQKLLDCVGASV
jgi:hypothetical protein